MKQVITIGLDIAKNVFQVHGVDEAGQVTLQRKLRRAGLLSFFAKQPACVVGLEACASAHYWARELKKLGHDVRLVPPSHVKPYVKRGRKNDAVDAAAICEAVTRPHMRFVPIKTEEQQAVLMLHRARRLLMTQRTMVGNAIRSHFAEFGIIAPLGETGLATLITVALDAADQGLPQAAREALAMLAAQWRDSAARIEALDLEIAARHRADSDSVRVATIPGIGALIASAIVASIGDASRFDNGRQFAAWLGLVPAQNSTGGKTVLGRITKMGDSYLRTMIIVGATSALRVEAKKQGSWAARLLDRMSWRQASVALANKMARTAWAILAHGGTYGNPAQAAV